MMDSNNISIMIKEILSLRYHPSLEIDETRRTPKDFEPENAPNYLSHIEDLILKIYHA